MSNNPPNNPNVVGAPVVLVGTPFPQAGQTNNTNHQHNSAQNATSSTTGAVTTCPAQCSEKCSSWFPLLSWTSAQGILIILQIFTYVVAAVFVRPWVSDATANSPGSGISPGKTLGPLWGPSSTANWKIGASDAAMVRCATSSSDVSILELRRFFFPMFLHVNIIHLAFNLYFQLAQGTVLNVEWEQPPSSAQQTCYCPLPSCQGWCAANGPFLFVFLISGLSGNLLSDCFGVSGVGASTACFGIIGAQLGRFTIVDYPKLGEIGSPGALQHRASLTRYWGQVVMFLIFFEIINWHIIDHYGHLGGFLGGVCCGLLVEKRKKVQRIQRHDGSIEIEVVDVVLASSTTQQRTGSISTMNNSNWDFPVSDRQRLVARASLVLLFVVSLFGIFIVGKTPDGTLCKWYDTRYSIK